MVIWGYLCDDNINKWIGVVYFGLINSMRFCLSKN